jgi:hypothetical protein
MSELADTIADVTVPVPATLYKGWQRKAETEVTIADTVRGRGSSRKAAIADAAAQVDITLRNLTAKPAVVRDGDGALWFLFAHREGTEYRRMTPEGQFTSCISWGGGTPAEHADSLVANHAAAVRVL